MEWLLDGREPGVTLASMYPADFDAIIAGASPDIRARVHGVRMLLHRFVHRSAGSYIPPQKYPAVHQAVMDACDARDGVKDGVLDNPRLAASIPKCSSAKAPMAPSCLTAEQVETARALYSDVKHPLRASSVLAPAGARLRAAVGHPCRTTAIWQRGGSVQVSRGERRGVGSVAVHPRPTWSKWTRWGQC